MMLSHRIRRNVIPFIITLGCVYNLLWSSSCESNAAVSVTAVMAFQNVRCSTTRSCQLATNNNIHCSIRRQRQEQQQQKLHTLRQPFDHGIVLKSLQKQHDPIHPNNIFQLSKVRIGRNMMMLSLSSTLMLLAISLLATTALAADVGSGTDISTVPSTSTSSSSSIVACRPTSTSGGNNNNNNCVSTASVKQVDLFMLPWTWSESISGDEVISRMKGIIAADQTLSLIDSNVFSTDNYFFRIRAARNVCTDEIEFLINPTDHVITFRSQQVDGPDSLSDFGANRRRLEDIRQRLKVVTILGSGGGEYVDGMNTNNIGESTEGLTGQLKAFWGFRSGGGFESILLDEDE